MFQCLVICPFGSDSGSDRQKILLRQLEGLHDHVFKVAAATCRRKKYPVRISDTRKIKHGLKEVKGAVQKCIDESHAVIVILSDSNPNVFLELGWAQGMWQAPILLKHNDYDLPADIKGDLYLPFGDKHIDGSDKSSAKELGHLISAEIIDRIETGRREKPFLHWPPTTLARGSAHLYNRFLFGVTHQQWSKMIADANEEIIFVGTGMVDILKQKFFPKDSKKEQDIGKILLDRALDGIHVTVVCTFDDDLPGKSAGSRKPSEKVTQFENAWYTLKAQFEALSKQLERKGSFRIIRLRRYRLPFRATVTDQRALVTLRLYIEIYNSGVCIDVPAPTPYARKKSAEQNGKEEWIHNIPLYDQIKKELDFVVEQNADHSDKDYQRWNKRAVDRQGKAARASPGRTRARLIS